MPRGSSAKEKASQLRRNQARFQENQAQLDGLEQEFHLQTEKLLQTVDRQTREARAHSQEAQDVLRLEGELATAAAMQVGKLGEQHEHLQAEHRRALEQRLVLAHEEAEAKVGDGDRCIGDEARAECSEAVFAEQVVQAQISHSHLVRNEELRAERVREELLRVRAEVHIFTQERDSEAEAACITREAFEAERRAARRHGVMLRAEVRAQVSETEAMQDSQRCLQERVRQVQRELGNFTYAVGQHDQRLKERDSELQEVRQSLVCIQEEMDEVNQQLEQQCNRVHCIEGSLRQSCNLGDGVQIMRSMLGESHSALAQLCSMLEQERSRREQCTQGLRQQRVRTELLLQLLQHFKSRAQELAPQALLSSNSRQAVSSVSCMGPNGRASAGREPPLEAVAMGIIN